MRWLVGVSLRIFFNFSYVGDVWSSSSNEAQKSLAFTPIIVARVMTTTGTIKLGGDYGRHQCCRRSRRVRGVVDACYAMLGGNTYCF